MVKVIFTKKAESRLEKLVFILYKNEYFAFMESAMEYVQKLRLFANSIPNERNRLCKNRRYGEWYCRYKHSDRTTWYFTFDTDGENYIIRNVLNNHTREYPLYIMGLK